jgi:hypothetical protein
MSYYHDPKPGVPAWVKFVALGILAAATLALTIYALSLDSSPILIPASNGFKK